VSTAASCRVDSARVIAVRMPLRSPWRTSFGSQPDITTVLVRLTSGDAVGWGEAAPGSWPLFCGEWAGPTFELVHEFLLPRLVGRDVAELDALTALFAPVRGNTFAKAAVETAWWALRGALEGRPLSEYLGGTRRQVEAGADFDIHDDTSALLAKIDEAAGSGCPRVKLKVGGAGQLGQLREVRRSFPELTLHVDCNAAFSRDDLDFLLALDELDLAMIEQPMATDDFVGHALLQQRIDTPVCLDESIRSAADLELAVRLGCCRYVSIKPGRVGGLWPATLIGRAAQRAGIGAVVGNMLESPVGAQLCLALASCDWATYPADLFPAQRFFDQPLAEQDLRPAPGSRWSYLVPGEPGNPAVPIDEVVAKWLVADSGVLTG